MPTASKLLPPALGLALSMGGCLLPGPERVDELNAHDERLVRDQAQTDLSCAAEKLRIEGPPNTLNRITTWTVEGCHAQARYRVNDGVAERVD